MIFIVVIAASQFAFIIVSEIITVPVFPSHWWHCLGAAVGCTASRTVIYLPSICLGVGANWKRNQIFRLTYLYWSLKRPAWLEFWYVFGPVSLHIVLSCVQRSHPPIGIFLHISSTFICPRMGWCCPWTSSGWCVRQPGETEGSSPQCRHIEDSSCLRVEDRGIFSKRVAEKLSEEGARFFWNTRGKDVRSSTRKPLRILFLTHRIERSIGQRHEDKS